MFLPKARLARYGAAAAALAALAAGVYLAVSTRTSRGTLRGVTAAWEQLSYRPTTARLSSLAYVPRPRTAAPDHSSLPLIEVRQAASEYLQEGISGDAHERGVAALLAARFEDAVQSLEVCTRTNPAEARCWTDLAAAQIEIGRQRNDPRAFASAFAAADRAVGIARTSEALFNRAVALEELQLARPAAVAWRRYLAVDGSSSWAVEARERLSVLDAAQPTTDWKSPSQPQLAAAARRRDLAALAAVVRSDPQNSRAWSERYGFANWGEAVARGDEAGAAFALTLVRDIAAAVQSLNGEQLLADAVRVAEGTGRVARRSLAAAHVAYRDARALQTERRNAEALPLFEASARDFRRAGSPMHFMAEYFVAVCLSDLEQTDAAWAAIDATLREAPAGYRALRGQLLWQRGTVASRAGLYFEALQPYRDALGLFRGLGEGVNMAYVGSALAALSAMLGRDAEAWRFRIDAFRGASRSGNAQVLQTVLDSCARSAIGKGRWDVATAFYGLALDPELDPPNVVRRTDASTWRSLAAHRLGLPDVAVREAGRARRTLREIRDPSMQATSAMRLTIAEALIARDDDPARAVALLTAAIEGAQHQREAFFLSEALLERGRAFRDLGQPERAIADFRESLAVNETRERGASDAELRDSYFAVTDSASFELIDLLDQRGEREAVLAVADRNRGRSFPADAMPANALAIPRGTLVAHFTSLPDRLLIAGIDAGGTELHRVSVARDTLRPAIAALRAHISARRDDAARRVGQQLFATLLAPLAPQLGSARMLVIVPDETIAAVPFAALVRPDGSFLVESHTIAYAPSAAYFARALTRPEPAMPRARRALAIGDPAFDRALAPELPALGEARREAVQLGKAYQQALVLTGADASKPRVTAALASYPVIDIACHTVADPRDPTRSLLLLAPSPDDSGALYLRDVARMSLPASDVVILAACRTAATAERTSAAMRSFALAFLAAGSRNAVGTLWDIEDDAARRLSTTLHRHLREQLAPAEALRLAQLTLLRSDDARLRSLHAWSGFQLYGVGN